MNRLEGSLKKVLKRFFQDKMLLFFLVVVITTVVFRFLWIDAFPVGINHDEVDVVLSAKTYWKFGADISGVRFPVSLIATKAEAGLSGLPSFILAPIIGPFKLSPQFVRLPFIIINIVSLAFLVALVWELTKNRTLTFITLLISLINPWLYLYSRSTTEAPFALMFILMGIYLMYKFRGTKIIYSILPFILAFYSYFGAKPIVAILVSLLLLGRWYLYGKRRSRLYVIYGVSFLIFIGMNFIALKSVPDSTFMNRNKELVFLNLDRFSEQVNEQRRAIISVPLTNIFANKPKELATQIAKSYVGWISPDYLFFGGDEGATYRLDEHGTLYILDLAFIILGIAGLLSLKKIQKQKTLQILIVTLFIVGPVGSSLSLIGKSYFFRGFLLIPLLIILISLGVAFLLQNIPKAYLRVVAVCLTLLYLASFANFLYFFFFRYPVRQQENQFLSERVLVNYLFRAKEEGKNIEVVLRGPLAVYQQYLFFSNYFEKAQAFDFPTDKYLLDGISFVDKCEDISGADIMIIESGFNCEEIEGKDFLMIQNQKDAGTRFRIYNDQLCESIMLSPWRRTHLVSDYLIEEMERDTFCNRWINK